MALAAALGAAACRAAPEPPRPGERPTVGLMTTLPLLWGEAQDVGELLSVENRPSWVRQELGSQVEVEPLDILEETTLARLDGLILAQPRALSPAENVALDAWVREGGRLLLFADPMLTAHSRFAVGDRRRPHDVVLLSPILRHWNLELQFDEDQGEAERLVQVQGTPIPVALAGRFAAASGAPCELGEGAVLAQCRIGRGRVVAFADAALLDDPAEGDVDARKAALGKLLALAFD